jgi:hypothetical protein
MEIAGTVSIPLAHYFKGQIPEVGQEVVQVCTGRTETSVMLKWMVKLSVPAATVNNWNSTDGSTTRPLTASLPPDLPETESRANRSWVP